MAPRTLSNVEGRERNGLARPRSHPLIWFDRLTTSGPRAPLDARVRGHDDGRLPAHLCTTIQGRLFAGKPIGNT